MARDEAFLAGIRAAPDDDALRMVYADWLDEHDEAEQAQLIRMQVALAALPDDDARRPVLADCERALLARHGEGWLAAARAAAPAGVELAFRRGLVEASAPLMLVRDFLDQGESLFAGLPLRRVRLAGLREALPWARAPRPGEGLAAELARFPLLARLPELDLAPSFTLDDDLVTLAASPHLVGLSWLGLGDCGRMGQAPRPTWAGVRALAASPHLTRLRFLGMDRLRLGRACLEALAEAAHLPRLEELDWTDNRCRDGGLRALLASPLGARLTTLRLGSNNLGAGAGEALAEVESPLALRVLDLGNPSAMPRRNALGGAGAAALARAPALAGLHTLSLRGNGVGDEGIEALASSPHLAGLRRLDLSGNGVGRGVWALASTRGLAGLRELDLSDNRVADSAAEALFALALPELRRLVLTGNPLGERCRARLAAHFGGRVEGVG